jgi:gamma-glutamyltranspeptidase/glutathione hydrolase
MDYRCENWQLSKPAKISEAGMVAAQSAEAAAVGAEVLDAGGNAVDAAVATAFALGATEPWMSGIGGGGYMLVYLAAEQRTYAIDYAMVAPARLDVARYALSGEPGPEGIFVWPRVVEDRNLHGAESICVPGAADGLGTALERFGTITWRDALAPAIALAEKGLAADWWNAADLMRFESSRDIYLPGGVPPTSATPSNPARISLGNLAATLRQLAEGGRRELYEGDLARTIVDEVRAAGGALSRDDLAGYQTQVVDPLTVDYRGATVNLAPGLNGSPTCARAIRTLVDTLGPGDRPGPDAYRAYAEALREAYGYRFAHLGHDGDPEGLACTTHLCAIDAAGNMVSLTNTLLERFGSKWVLPETGILMNNGMMWFDPNPGGPNSIAPGQRPLSNMCPVLVTRDGSPAFALGASGGRRIVPTGLQLTSFLLDFGLSLEDAFHTPRIDVSGGDTVLCDRELPQDCIDAIAADLPIELMESAVMPRMFACPSAVQRNGGRNIGAIHVPSPSAAVMVAGESR